MIRNDKPKEDIAKFREVLQHVLNKVGGKGDIDEVSINNLMYFIDFDFYEKYEEQLTGAIYIKNGNGAMNRSARIKVIKSQIAKFNDNIDIEKKRCKTKSLTKREEKHINDTLSRFFGKNIVNARDKGGKSGNIKHNVDYETQIRKNNIAELIRKDVPYIATAEGNEIAYEAVFYRTEATSIRCYR